MLEFLKNLGRLKPAPTYRDSLLGRLVRNAGGVWCGEMPYRDYHVKVLLPGAEYRPSSTRLALARALVPDIQAKADSASDYARKSNPQLWRGRFSLSALNLIIEDAGGDAFALDFVATGDLSGNCWRVRFERRQPVHLGYIKRTDCGPPCLPRRPAGVAGLLGKDVRNIRDRADLRHKLIGSVDHDGRAHL